MQGAVVEDITFERKRDLKCGFRRADSGAATAVPRGGFPASGSRTTCSTTLTPRIRRSDWGKPPYLHPFQSLRLASQEPQIFQYHLGSPDVSIEHNTFIQAQGRPRWNVFDVFPSELGGRRGEPVPVHGQHRCVVCFRFQQGRKGNPTLDFYTPAARLRSWKNALIGRSTPLNPAGTFSPPDIARSASPRVRPTTVTGSPRVVPTESPGTDGKDLGADIGGADDALRELRLVVIHIKPGEEPPEINTKSRENCLWPSTSSRTFSVPDTGRS